MQRMRAWGSLLAGSLSLCACSDGFGPFATCPEGSSISDRALVDVAVGKLVREIRASRHPGGVHYQTVPEFYAHNPSCCSIEKPEAIHEPLIQLPLSEETEITILYKRMNVGDTPYSYRYVSVGPCPTHMEEAERYLTAEQFSRAKTSKRGRIIK